MCVCIYVYVYVCIYTCACIYMYILKTGKNKPQTTPQLGTFWLGMHPPVYLPTATYLPPPQLPLWLFVWGNVPISKP